MVMETVTIRPKYANGKYVNSQIAQSMRCYYANPEKYNRQRLMSYMIRKKGGVPQQTSIDKYGLKFDNVQGWH